MDGLLVIKLKDATPLEIEEQFQMRIERIQSNVAHKLAVTLMERCNDEPISILEIMDMLGRDQKSCGSIIRNLRTAHGLDIANVSQFGLNGSYQLVGFSERDYRPHIKPTKRYNIKSKGKLKPRTYNPLINSVFC